MKSPLPRLASIVAALLLASAAASCTAPSALQLLAQARQLAADLQVQFTRATDAANRAVMADTDDASAAFAREAGQATQAVQTDIDALTPVLRGLGYTEEGALLQEFVARFAEYRDLDRRILDLAVENTNLKAQRLSFGPASEAADAYADALASLASSGATSDAWRIRALAAKAVASVREIQALQAPHIADAGDAGMTRLEQRMAAAEAAARAGLGTLAGVVPAADRARLRAATTALDQFMEANARIVALSRRNTNVRSLALSLNEKGKITGACDSRLQALREALGRRELGGTR